MAGYSEGGRNRIAYGRKLYLPAALMFVCAVRFSGPAMAAEGTDGSATRMENVIAMSGAGFEVFDAPQVTRNMLLGINGPVHYRLQVEPGQEVSVVLAFFETTYGREGQRVVRCEVEGAEPRLLDPIAEAGWKKAVAIAVDGEDADNDGWVNVSVRADQTSVDKNATLAGVWLFDRQSYLDRSMTTQQVLEGKQTEYAFYAIDCGKEDRSLLVQHALARYSAAAQHRVAGLRQVAADHGKVAEALGDAVGWLAERAELLQTLQQQGKLTEMVRHRVEFGRRLAAAVASAEARLADVYLPAFDQPAQTHLSSPWGGLIRLRQEDTLAIDLELAPLPESLDHKYHPRYAYRDVFGTIEIIARTPAREESTRLGLDYDLGLQSIDYDPLETCYRYAGGTIRVQVLDKAALRIWSNTMDFDVKWDTARLGADGDRLVGSADSIHDTRLFGGVMFHRPDGGQAAHAGGGFDLTADAVTCRAVTLYWADTAEELRQLGEQLRDWRASQRQTCQWVRRHTDAGRVEASTDLARRADIDRRTLLSTAQVFGGVPAALDGGYDAVWVRDTTIVAVATALAGNPHHLQRWTPYVMANPTPAEIDGKHYKTFIIAPYDKQHIFKMEDDGPFYAALSVYAYWKLLGPDNRLAEWYDTLDSAMQFLQVKSYDAEIGLYSEALINEAPLKDSPYWKDEKHDNLKIGDDWPMRVHSLYVNHLMYASHLIMGELSLALDKPEAAVRHFARADQLAATVDEKLWNPDTNAYWAGLAIMDDGRIIPVDWNYHDIYFDYIWALSLYPILPNTQRSIVSLDAMVEAWPGDFPTRNGRFHMVSSLGHAACSYVWFGNYDKAARCLRFMADHAQKIAYNETMQAVYAMRGAMPEWTWNVQFHRPQTFAAGPCLNGIVSLGASLDYSGVNVVPSDYVARVDNLIYRDAVLDIDARVQGTAAGIVVDGHIVPGTMRIPAELLTAGRHAVRVLDASELKPGQSADPLLEFTNLELSRVERQADLTTFHFNGYGRCFARFRKIDAEAVRLLDAEGNEMPVRHWSTRHGEWIGITATGEPLRLVIRHGR